MNDYFKLWWKTVDLKQAGAGDGHWTEEQVKSVCEAAWVDATGVIAAQLMLRLRKLLKECKNHGVGADETRARVMEELIKFVSE